MRNKMLIPGLTLAALVTAGLALPGAAAAHGTRFAPVPTFRVDHGHRPHGFERHHRFGHERHYRRHAKREVRHEWREHRYRQHERYRDVDDHERTSVRMRIDYGYDF